MLFFAAACSPAWAVDVAPRITDREIIEGLAKIETVRTEITALHAEMNTRFDAQQKQIDFIGSLILVLTTLVGAQFGFIVWDRRTVLQPLEKRVELMQREFEQEHRAQVAEQPQLLKLVEALKNHAQSDSRLAECLRSVKLL